MIRCRKQSVVTSAMITTITMIACAAPALGQPADVPSEPPAVAETPPSLDELLGLDEDERDEAAATAAEREAEDALQQQLAEEEIGDAFAAAIEKMALSAELLDRRFDAGLGTQRIQEDVIAKLDQLIEFAKQQQSSSSCSNPSGSSTNSDSSSAPQPKQQNAQQQQQASQRNPNPTDSQEGDPPQRQDGDINTMLEESRTEWGGLPPRIRNELLQGRSDKYSALYEQLTREYYQRLAEEGSP
jgi:hypothetical protein